MMVKCQCVILKEKPGTTMRTHTPVHIKFGYAPSLSAALIFFERQEGKDL